MPSTIAPTMVHYIARIPGNHRLICKFPQYYVPHVGEYVHISDENNGVVHEVSSYVRGYGIQEVHVFLRSAKYDQMAPETATQRPGD